MRSNLLHNSSPDAVSDEETLRESAGSQAKGLRTVARALRHRNYQLYFGGQLISLIGTWMQSVAQSWLIYRLTGSTIALGLVGFSSQIPVFLLAPIGGAVADRYNRHRILIGTQTLSMLLAFVLSALTLTGAIREWHIYAMAALLGLVNAFDIPGRQAFIVDLVGREDLINAIALNSSMVNGARIVGPAVAGVLVSLVGEGWCFLLNGFSYIAVITGLLMMRLSARMYQKGAAPGLPTLSKGSVLSPKRRPFAPCCCCSA